MLRVTPGNRLRLAVMARKRDNYTARSLLELAGFFLFFFVFFVIFFAQPADKQQWGSDQRHRTTGAGPARSGTTSFSNERQRRNMATVTRVTSEGLLELSATAGCHRRVPESGGGAGGTQQARTRGRCHCRVRWALVVGFFFSLFFCSSSRGGGGVRRRVPVPHLLQNVNPGHNKWNICKAPGVISANCILISAVMGRRSAPSRREDGDKWPCGWQWMDRNGSRAAVSQRAGPRRSDGRKEHK